MQRVQLEAGQLVFKEGDKSDVAYVVESGKVEILKKAPHGDVSLATLGPGEMFGEMGLFEDRPRSATARAVEITILNVMDHQAVMQMVEQCSQPLRQLVKTAFERLQAANQKITEKDKAVTVVECDFDKVVIMPDCEKLATIFTPVEVPVNKLPFRIGGYSHQEEAPGAGSSQNHLELPSEGPPLMISRKHLQIELQENVAYLVDRGSRFGTIVNGKAIGRGKGDYKHALAKGEFAVRLGGVHSPYQIKLVCQ
ncbi:cyclic nucleotide-binding domain-containing protein [bacterium]|nr:cyclic nucleotide-binding domain-containing protein [bacterium]